MLRPLDADGSVTNEDNGTESDDLWTGVSDEELPPVDHEAEYVDEEKYTTVTVETMDVSKEGLFKAQEARDEQHDQDGNAAPTAADGPTEKPKRPWTKDKPKDSIKKRKKKRNFKYENKAERKDARSKQKARNQKQARERRADH